MGLFSFLRRQPDPAPRKRKAPAAAPLDPSAVEQARVRARRRLIGAAVLVLIAVIGFPLLFETAPRPVPSDLPIVIAGRDTAAPALPVVRPGAAAVAPAPVPAPAPSTRAVAPAPVIEERADEGGRDVTPSVRTERPSVAAPASANGAVKSEKPQDRAAEKVPRPSEKPADRAADKAAEKSADKAAADRARAAEAAKAQALLEGRKPAAKAEEGGRYIVQVGAFTEAEALREARQRVERLGLKTYTQEVVANGARRTRVRVGPFASREEADRAATKLKAAGLGAAVLTL